MVRDGTTRLTKKKASIYPIGYVRWTEGRNMAEVPHDCRETPRRAPLISAQTF
jgi:hypothetical protein